METLKLKRKAERLKCTRLIPKIEAMLTQNSVTEDELCILNEHLEHLHTDLRATDSHIVFCCQPRKLRQSLTSHSDVRETLVSDTSTSGVQEACTTIDRTRATHAQPTIQLPKIDLMKLDDQPLVQC
ncbi:hypothetical protein HPB52_006026 [Rhipicephalus sanguineus]|uniref:Uncharacterized protein n=1 Tax=Rhipicephalus sanguineus TaxID=34632 RepID=A0A9D4SS41_RHISA|nr:hypothetical protein HPB52_006026 [Rhipicephalus sanguineus]